MEAPPYMPSVKNLPAILNRIQEAGAPPRFSAEFLKTSLGFSSSNDRAVISVLRRLGFISTDGQPTDRYNQFRSGEHGGAAISDGLREGWADIFLADQKANEKSSSQLKDLFKTATGKSESVAEKMAATFKTLAERADWSAPSGAQRKMESPVAPPRDVEGETGDESKKKVSSKEPSGNGVLSLKHDIHVHLPPTSDVAVYRAIFRAIKEELSD